jgi:hypothetical protein
MDTQSVQALRGPCEALWNNANLRWYVYCGQRESPFDEIFWIERQGTTVSVVLLLRGLA